MKKELKKKYKESWKYIRESKNYIYVIIGVFFTFFLIGLIIPAPPEISEKILEFIQELIDQTEGMNFIELLLFIFLNNLKASLMGLIFGIFLGVLPIIFSLANGYLLGFVSAVVTKEEGLISLWKLMPHGIFELPAVFISLGLGIKLGTFIFKKEKIETFREYAIKSFNSFILIIIPLLIIAAIIETSLIFLL